MKCPKCDGEFELKEAVKEIDQDLRWMDFDLWKDQDYFDVSQGALVCPRCNVPMATVKYGPTDIQVDTCINCHGVWLDKGEFEQIISALENEVSSMSEDEYWDVALDEARELIDGDDGFISEWRNFKTVMRLLQYRILVENPQVREALAAFQRGTPFQ
jgi:Zn-finger nucleic acid-binding protein